MNRLTTNNFVYLIKSYNTIPHNTRYVCGHEYTNLVYAPADKVGNGLTSKSHAGNSIPVSPCTLDSCMVQQSFEVCFDSSLIRHARFTQGARLRPQATVHDWIGHFPPPAQVRSYSTVPLGKS